MNTTPRTNSRKPKLPPVEIQVETAIPASQACEREVLGALLESAELWAECMDAGLCETDFFFEDHRRIFQTMLALSAAGTPVDVHTVVDALGSDDHYFVVLCDLINGVVLASGHTLAHVRILKRKARLRELIRLGEFLQEAATAPGADPDAITAEVVSQLTARQTING